MKICQNYQPVFLKSGVILISDIHVFQSNGINFSVDLNYLLGYFIAFFYWVFFFHLMLKISGFCYQDLNLH